MRPVLLGFFLLLGVMRSASPEPPPLKEAFARDFDMGVACASLASLSPEERALIVREFKVITPGSHFKPDHTQPAEGRFTFEQADALVDFAQSNGLAVVGHTLAWHNQTPAWFFADGPNPASRELLLKRLRDHIHAVVGRYRGRVKGWDVVNEGLSDKSDEYLRPNKWQQMVGDDYIAQAFAFAQEADPGAELYFNDYGTEYPHKRAKLIRLVKELQARGIRIDGVGIQCHLQLDRIPFEELEQSIAAFHALGVKVMITELDLDLVERLVWGADTTQHEEPTATNLGWKVAPPELLQRQAEQYAQLFRIFRRQHAAVDRVTIWHLHDGKSFLNNWPVKGRTNHPLLFDRHLQPKPAFDAVLAVASEPRS
ncbi:MAG: endo-1,4-beta-xylanase [Lacunisphaera sp.]|nr:endo-1,4-beta-xylanase [Lacunisphaera sp.]